jgi:8-oxo-dGTP diphosphatase
LKRRYPIQPVVGVGAVILKKKSMLLEKRKNDPGRGKWSIPGGVVELGETLHQAVKREVKEETGLTVEVNRLVDAIDSITLDEKNAVKYDFVVIDFLVDVREGDLHPSSDAEELKWVPFNQIEKYNLTDSFRIFFKKNRRTLEEG